MVQWAAVDCQAVKILERKNTRMRLDRRTDAT